MKNIVFNDDIEKILKEKDPRNSAIALQKAVTASRRNVSLAQSNKDFTTEDLTSNLEAVANSALGLERVLRDIKKADKKDGRIVPITNLLFAMEIERKALAKRLNQELARAKGQNSKLSSIGNSVASRDPLTPVGDGRRFTGRSNDREPNTFGGFLGGVLINTIAANMINNRGGRKTSRDIGSTNEVRGVRESPLGAFAPGRKVNATSGSDDSKVDRENLKINRSTFRRDTENQQSQARFWEQSQARIAEKLDNILDAIKKNGVGGGASSGGGFDLPDIDIDIGGKDKKGRRGRNGRNNRGGPRPPGGGKLGGGLGTVFKGAILYEGVEAAIEAGLIPNMGEQIGKAYERNGIGGAVANFMDPTIEKYLYGSPDDKPDPAAEAAAAKKKEEQLKSFSDKVNAQRSAEEKSAALGISGRFEQTKNLLTGNTSLSDWWNGRDVDALLAKQGTENNTSAVVVPPVSGNDPRIFPGSIAPKVKEDKNPPILQDFRPPPVNTAPSAESYLHDPKNFEGSAALFAQRAATPTAAIAATIGLPVNTESVQNAAITPLVQTPQKDITPAVVQEKSFIQKRMEINRAKMRADAAAMEADPNSKVSETTTQNEDGSITTTRSVSGQVSGLAAALEGNPNKDAILEEYARTKDIGVLFKPRPAAPQSQISLPADDGPETTGSIKKVADVEFEHRAKVLSPDVEINLPGDMNRTANTDEDEDVDARLIDNLPIPPATAFEGSPILGVADDATINVQPQGNLIIQTEKLEINGLRGGGLKGNADTLSSPASPLMSSADIPGVLSGGMGGGSGGFSTGGASSGAIAGAKNRRETQPVITKKVESSAFDNKPNMVMPDGTGGVGTAGGGIANPYGFGSGGTGGFSAGTMGSPNQLPGRVTGSYNERGATPFTPRGNTRVDVDSNAFKPDFKATMPDNVAGGMGTREFNIDGTLNPYGFSSLGKTSGYDAGKSTVGNVRSSYIEPGSAATSGEGTPYTDPSKFQDPSTNPNVNQDIVQKYARQGRQLPVVIRNNNPAALSLMRPGSGNEFAEKQEGYVGATPRPANEGGFYAKFATPEHGVAANAKLLERYGEKGVNTTDQIVRKWSVDPNAHAAYSKRLQEALGVSGNTQLDLNDKEIQAKILEAKSAHESGTGKSIYSPDTFRRGVNRDFSGGKGPAPTAAPGSTVSPQTSTSPQASTGTMGEVGKITNRVGADLENVDPKLKNVGAEAARMFARDNPGYTAEILGPAGGFRRSGSTANHGAQENGLGGALDFGIRGPDGKLLANRSNVPGAEQAFEKYANLHQNAKIAQQALHPEMPLGSGFAFDTSRGSGQKDWMHIDKTHKNYDWSKPFTYGDKVVPGLDNKTIQERIAKEYGDKPQLGGKDGKYVEPTVTTSPDSHAGHNHGPNGEELPASPYDESKTFGKPFADTTNEPTEKPRTLGAFLKQKGADPEAVRKGLADPSVANNPAPVEQPPVTPTVPNTFAAFPLSPVAMQSSPELGPKADTTNRVKDPSLTRDLQAEKEAGVAPAQPSYNTPNPQNLPASGVSPRASFDDRFNAGFGTNTAGTANGGPDALRNAYDNARNNPSGKGSQYNPQSMEELNKSLQNWTSPVSAGTMSKPQGAIDSKGDVQLNNVDALRAKREKADFEDNSYDPSTFKYTPEQLKLQDERKQRQEASEFEGKRSAAWDKYITEGDETPEVLSARGAKEAEALAGPKDGESFADFLKRRSAVDKTMGSAENQTQNYDDARRGFTFSAKDLNEELNKKNAEKLVDGSFSQKYAESLESGERITPKEVRAKEFRPDQPLSTSQIISQYGTPEYKAKQANDAFDNKFNAGWDINSSMLPSGPNALNAAMGPAPNSVSSAQSYGSERQSAAPPPPPPAPEPVANTESNANSAPAAPAPQTPAPVAPTEGSAPVGGSGGPGINQIPTKHDELGLVLLNTPDIN